jgi:hypothetical protein
MDVDTGQNFVMKEEGNSTKMASNYNMIVRVYEKEI